MHYKTLIVTAVVLAYLAMGYYPFELEMPVRVTQSGASYSEADGLTLIREIDYSRPGSTAWAQRSPASYRRERCVWGAR